VSPKGTRNRSASDRRIFQNSILESIPIISCSLYLSWKRSGICFDSESFESGIRSECQMSTLADFFPLSHLFLVILLYFISFRFKIFESDIDIMPRVWLRCLYDGGLQVCHRISRRSRPQSFLLHLILQSINCPYWYREASLLAISKLVESPPCSIHQSEIPLLALPSANTGWTTSPVTWKLNCSRSNPGLFYAYKIQWSRRLQRLLFSCFAESLSWSIVSVGISASLPIFASLTLLATSMDEFGGRFPK